ncbi:hypothetical protein [Paeniglutamicibacter antarcticus]|uniref:hypothetical protein n=1 Tax=Paeniglutamicibacter antarcticus TaxID=494023 RepID=UPI001AE2B0DA
MASGTLVILFGLLMVPARGAGILWFLGVLGAFGIGSVFIAAGIPDRHSVRGV